MASGGQSHTQLKNESQWADESLTLSDESVNLTVQDLPTGQPHQPRANPLFMFFTCLGGPKNDLQWPRHAWRIACPVEKWTAVSGWTTIYLFVYLFIYLCLFTCLRVVSHDSAWHRTREISQSVAKLNGKKCAWKVGQVVQPLMTSAWAGGKGLRFSRTMYI